jgi:hypothetical protein
MAGHERRDVRARTVVRWTAGIFGLLVVALTTMWLLLGRFDTRLAEESPPASPLADYAPKQPPEPRLQVDPGTDLARLRSTEQAQLDGYGWVDRQAGTVHIPIERAMQLLVERRAKATP